jgi:class 3 adenylate cyclase/tetratricopeptide (TPR) repeat protein
MERRLAVILAADVIGYSRIMGEDEAVALGVIRDLKQEYFEPTVLEHGGEVLKRMGDGWIVAFSSISAAVQCAIETQNKLSGHPIIKLRIGAHIGEIVFDETDFHGASVNLAQRLETEAPPGGLMISQDLHRQLSGELAKAFTDAGSFKLKNIALPVNGFQWRPQRQTAARAGSVPSIAVESFEAAPDEPDTRAAAADLRDQLILGLSRRTGVRVLDESTGTPEDSDYVLRGRLRLKQGQGRCTLTLIVREEGRLVWSQTYQGDASDIFQFCDDLIQRANADLRVQINAFDADRIANLPDDELTVSELRSRAANAFFKLTVDSWTHALQLLNRALQLSPDDPMALAMRAVATVTLVFARDEEFSKQQIENLGEELDKAVESAPRSDYVFFARGLFRTYAQRDLAGALRDGERALALNPSYAWAHQLLGFVHLAGGRYDEAVRDLDKAISLSESDPTLPLKYYMHAIGQLCAGTPEQAAETIEQAIQLRPNQWAYHRLQAICHRKAGNDEAAEKAESRASALPREPSVLAHSPPLPPEQADLLILLSTRDGNGGGQAP